MRLDIHKEIEDKMSKSIEAFQEDLRNIRAGRANPSMLNSIVVDYYGVMTPLNQVSTVSAPEPRLLVVQAWDDNVVPNIEKAILKSDLGINPSTDGKVIRLPIPALTEERRKELVKQVKSNGEEAKIVVRNLRREANDEVKRLENEKEISEDDKIKAEEVVQEITNKYVAEVDEIMNAKEKELMEL